MPRCVPSSRSAGRPSVRPTCRPELSASTAAAAVARNLKQFVEERSRNVCGRRRANDRASHKQKEAGRTGRADREKRIRRRPQSLWDEKEWLWPGWVSSSSLLLSHSGQHSSDNEALVTVGESATKLSRNVGPDQIRSNDTCRSVLSFASINIHDAFQRSRSFRPPIMSDSERGNLEIPKQGNSRSRRQDGIQRGR